MNAKLTAAALAVAAAAAIAVLAPAAVAASDHHRHREHGEHGEHGEEGHEGRPGVARDAAAPADPQARALYRKECGACHLDFPPRLMSADGHRRIMAGLDRHFGQNAELDEATRVRLEGWLVQNAGGRGESAGPGEAPRFSASPWFARKHRKVSAAVTARTSVRTFVNCAACHRGAADWDFDEDRVKIPAT